MEDQKATNLSTARVYDESGMELPARAARTAIMWLVYQYGLTEAEATQTMISWPSRKIRQRQRLEAIDVADFVEGLNV